MKVTIKDYCIRCMMCQTMCPEVFEMDFENDVMRVKMDEVPKNLAETVRNVIKDCAVTAILVQRS
jgi:ferredoxin